MTSSHLTFRGKIFITGEDTNFHWRKLELTKTNQQMNCTQVILSLWLDVQYQRDYENEDVTCSHWEESQPLLVFPNCRCNYKCVSAELWKICDSPLKIVCMVGKRFLSTLSLAKPKSLSRTRLCITLQWNISIWRSTLQPHIFQKHICWPKNWMKSNFL